MENHRRIVALVVLMVSSLPATATEQLPKAIVLDGPAIITAFEGKTVSGAYASGLAVSETYALGGGISYWDPNSTTTGKWSVVNNLLCTFYDNMEGGCFRIERLSQNCFDYFALADSEEEALNPSGKPRYTARAAIDGAPSTCPDELAV